MTTLAGFREYETLVEKGWSEWRQIDKIASKGIPDFPGVYELGLNKPFPRLKGSTRTLYIGCSNKLGLRGRLGALTRPKGRPIARKRLERVGDALSETLWLRFRVTWIGEAEAAEKERFVEFEREHLELPPCNHSGRK
jgi:hypothetical protein